MLAGATLLSKRHDFATAPLSPPVVLGNGFDTVAAELGVNLCPRTRIFPDVFRMVSLLSKSVILIGGQGPVKT